MFEDIFLELFVGAEEDGLSRRVVDVEHLEEDAQDHGHEEELIHGEVSSKSRGRMTLISTPFRPRKQ